MALEHNQYETPDDLSTPFGFMPAADIESKREKNLKDAPQNSLQQLAQSSALNARMRAKHAASVEGKPFTPLKDSMHQARVDETRNNVKSIVAQIENSNKDKKPTRPRQSL